MASSCNSPNSPLAQALHSKKLLKSQNEAMTRDLLELEDKHWKLVAEFDSISKSRQQIQMELQVLRGNLEDERRQKSELLGRQNDMTPERVKQNITDHKKEVAQLRRDLEYVSLAHQELKSQNGKQKDALLVETERFEAIIRMRDEEISRLLVQLSEKNSAILELEKERSALFLLIKESLPIRKHEQQLEEVREEYAQELEKQKDMAGLSLKMEMDFAGAQETIRLLREELRSLKQKLATEEEARCSMAKQAVIRCTEMANKVGEYETRFGAMEARMAEIKKSLNDAQDAFGMQAARFKAEMARNRETDIRDRDLLEKQLAFALEEISKLKVYCGEKDMIIIELEKSRLLENQTALLRSELASKTQDVVESKFEGTKGLLREIEEENSSVFSSMLSLDTSTISRPSTAMSNVRSVMASAQRLPVAAESTLESDEMEVGRTIQESSSSLVNRISPFCCVKTSSRQPNRSSMRSSIRKKKGFRYGQSSAERRQELARRNQQQRPHLKSSYPTEDVDKTWHAADSSTPAKDCLTPSSTASVMMMGPPALPRIPAMNRLKTGYNKLLSSFSSNRSSKARSKLPVQSRDIIPTNLIKDFASESVSFDISPPPKHKKAKK